MSELLRSSRRHSPLETVCRFSQIVQPCRNVEGPQELFSKRHGQLERYKPLTAEVRETTTRTAEQSAPGIRNRPAVLMEVHGRASVCRLRQQWCHPQFGQSRAGMKMPHPKRRRPPIPFSWSVIDSSAVSPATSTA